MRREEGDRRVAPVIDAAGRRVLRIERHHRQQLQGGHPKLLQIRDRLDQAQQRSLALRRHRAALSTLAPGLAAKPLESRYGWHVISVDQRIDGQPLPYEAVATAIRTQLQQGVWQKALVQYLQTLIGAADIRGIRLQGADSPLVQ